MSVGQNKEDLLNLIKRVLIEVIRDFTICFCFRDCVEIKQNVESMRPDLHCDHEEADTMLVAYVSLVNSGGVMVRSPSGDIDIVTLFLYYAVSFDIFTDNGTGSHRKAIIGLHAFSGNDYLPSFFQKGKVTSWKKMCMKADYVAAFSSLGNTYLVATEVTQGIEKYVCALYGRSKLHSVNEARLSIFWDKHNRDKKIVELCMLPLCFGNLELHLKRSNYVAYIFRYANRLQLNLDQPFLHGWSETSVRWMDEYFPNDIHAVLITANEEEGEDE